MFHLKCLSTRLLFHDRNVIPSVLLASLVFNIVFVLKSKARSQTIQPAVVHEPHHGGSIRRQAWPTTQRYNKALVTNSALPLICLFLATGFWITAVQKFASNYVHFLLKGYSQNSILMAITILFYRVIRHTGGSIFLGNPIGHTHHHHTSSVLHFLA